MNSTLALHKAIYEAEVGEYMGFGRGSTDEDSPEFWTDDDAILVRMDVASGLRRFYFCGHPWSFLKPKASVVLQSGNSTVNLPDDFCGLDNGVKCAVLDSDDVWRCSLMFGNHGRVQIALDENGTSTGTPERVALRPLKAMAPGKMQAMELVVYPIANADYTLKFPYLITPNYLVDVTQPFAYGGVEHHETILECCLAIAEVRRDGVIGVHNAEALRLLQVSIGLDRLKQTKKLGYNGDRSDGYEDDRYSGRGRGIATGVTINDVLYD